MEWVETTAKTVETAKDLALDRLGVDEQDAEFEILEEPRPGLFGRVRGEARVRARVRPVQPRPKADRRDRRRGSKSGGSGGGSKGGGRGRGRRPESDEPAEDDAPKVEREDSPAPSTAGSGTGSAGRSGRRRGGSGATPRRRDERPTADAASGDNGEEPTMSEDVTVHEQAAMIEEFVEGLVDAFGYEASVGTTTIDDETVEVHVDGEDLGLLVGPKGATLQAIHDLSRTVVQRQASGNHEGRVRLDVAGYREKRRAALEKFTQKAAEEVIASGTARVLEPMAPADRKVVHDTANAIDGVRTTSEGDEPRRRVVILPAD